MCKDISGDVQKGYAAKIRVINSEALAFVQWQYNARSPVSGDLLGVPNLPELVSQSYLERRLCSHRSSVEGCCICRRPSHSSATPGRLVGQFGCLVQLWQQLLLLWPPGFLGQAVCLAVCSIHLARLTGLSLSTEPSNVVMEPTSVGSAAACKNWQSHRGCP